VRNINNDAHVFDFGSCFAQNLPTKDESGIKHLIGENRGDCVISNSSTEQTNRTKSNRLAQRVVTLA